jgi:hypothetical protein
MSKKIETPQERKARLLAEIEERNAANAAAWQGILDLKLDGAYYVLFAPVHGYVCEGESWDPDPAGEAVKKFNSPREALLSLGGDDWRNNPTSGDTMVRCVLSDGTLNADFRAAYYPPNNIRRLSYWPDDWKFFDGDKEIK